MNHRWILTGSAVCACLLTYGASPRAEAVVETGKNAKVAANGKSAVIERMREIFRTTKPPKSLIDRAFREMPAEMTEIKGADGRAILIYRFRYVNPEHALDALESLVTDSGSVEIVKKVGSTDDETSKVVIQDTAEKIAELKKVLPVLDRLQPQVLVETQIIEVYFDQGAERDVKISYTYKDGKYDTNNTFGFNLDSPTQNRDSSQGGGFDFIPYAFNQGDGSEGRLNAAIRWLNTSSDARTLSAPNILADQGTTASFITGEDLPIPETTALTSSTTTGFNYKRVGVTLKITPVIISGNTVQLSVNPEVKSVLRYENFPDSNSIPVISVRSIDTRLTVMNGDIIALGGLYSSEMSESMRKIPYLGDIPVIGDLLNGRDTKITDKQLIFLMKVFVLQPATSGTIDPESTARESGEVADLIKESGDIFPNKPPAEFFDVEGETNRTAKQNNQRRKAARAPYDEAKKKAVESGRKIEVPAKPAHDDGVPAQ